jgi:hypothetical protein
LVDRGGVVKRAPPRPRLELAPFKSAALLSTTITTTTTTITSTAASIAAQSHKISTNAAGPKVRSAGKTTFRDELSKETIEVCTRYMEKLMPEHVVRAFTELGEQLVQKNRAEAGGGG